MTIIAAAAADNTRKGHTAPTVQPSTNFINSNTDFNKLNELRVQRLIAVAGLSPALASVVAPMVFGGAA